MRTSIPPASSKELLLVLERAFDEHAGPGAVIDQEALGRALGLRSPYLAGRVLRALDQNGDGVVTREEFLSGVRAIIAGSDRDKLLFAFRLHDHDGDGTLSREEVLRMISISLAESEIAPRETQPPDVLASALFAAADRNKDGRISFDELEALVRERPELLQKMTRNEAIWIAPNEDVLSWLDARKRTEGTVWQGGWATTAVVALWSLACAVVFTVSMFRTPAPLGAPTWMRVGRALGACIDLNGALILIPMMRRLLGRVRATWLGRVIPVDDAVDFHKLVGHALFALALAHTFTFVVAYLGGHSEQLGHLFFGTRSGLSGLVLLVVFALMWFFSLSFIRRTRHFELFYFTHLLYVVWLVLVVVHGPRFLIWAGASVVGFAIEQTLRMRRRPKCAVTSSQPLRSGVTRLEVERPRGFSFSPGDYAFLCLPAIAKHEWHPFTISSAPERDALTFHVRSLGNWTGALRRHVEDEPDDLDLTAFVDGPYGSPSAHIFKSKYAMLIGGGIGVTPFASVLESLVLRANGASDRPCALRKAHFVWLNRDQYSFEWFTALLADLEELDHKGMLEVQLYMTNARGGATSLGLEAARAAMVGSEHGDIVTGLQGRTHFGPPDWQALLAAAKQEHAPERVDVYFCGPPGLAAKVRPICQRLGMTFYEERF